MSPQRVGFWIEAEVRGNAVCGRLRVILPGVAGHTDVVDASASRQPNLPHVILGGCPNCGITAFTNTQTGWVAGVGGEWAPWSNNWIFRLEYLHYAFDGANSTPARLAFPAAPPTFSWSNLTIDEVRAGLSFKF